MANKCEFCGKDCSFVSFGDGVCVECADKIQNAGWAWVINSLVQGGRQVNELQSLLKGQEKELVELRQKLADIESGKHYLNPNLDDFQFGDKSEEEVQAFLTVQQARAYLKIANTVIANGFRAPDGVSWGDYIVSLLPKSVSVS